MAVEQKKSVVDAYLQTGVYIEKDGKIFDRFNGTEIIPITETTNNSDTIENTDNADEVDAPGWVKLLDGFVPIPLEETVEGVIKVGKTLEDIAEKKRKEEIKKRTAEIGTLTGKRLKKYGRKS